VTESDPNLPLAAKRLGWLFAGQIMAMLLIIVGGVLLLVTTAHNNSLSCSPGFGFPSGGGCHHRSYALPLGLLIGGFAWFLVGMAVTAAVSLRTGASVLDSLLKRRR
jgi:hypothetical protein